MTSCPTQYVARIERSEIRGVDGSFPFPDFAALYPGYI